MKLIANATRILLGSMILVVPLQAADVIIIAGQSNAWRLGGITKGPIKLAHPMLRLNVEC